MATYRMKGASLIGTLGSAFRMPLICEQCHDTLGIAAVEEECDGLSAGDVARLWPHLAPEVSLHEALCPDQG